MKTLKLVATLLICAFFLAVNTADAQCRIHSNFTNYATASGLKDQYTVKLTIISPRVGSHDYTAYGTGEFCNTSFRSGCTKSSSSMLYFSDRKTSYGHYFNSQKRDKQTMTIDFLNNTLTLRLNSWGGKETVYQNIRKRGNNFYIIKNDGMIISFKLVKGAVCLI